MTGKIQKWSGSLERLEPEVCRLVAGGPRPACRRVFSNWYVVLFFCFSKCLNELLFLRNREISHKNVGAQVSIFQVGWSVSLGARGVLGGRRPQMGSLRSAGCPLLRALRQSGCISPASTQLAAVGVGSRGCWWGEAFERCVLCLTQSLER